MNVAEAEPVGTSQPSSGQEMRSQQQVHGNLQRPFNRNRCQCYSWLWEGIKEVLILRVAGMHRSACPMGLKSVWKLGPEERDKITLNH